MGISFKKFVPPSMAGWNGGLAVNSFIGQLQKEFFVTKMAFPARPGATYFEFLIVYVASPHMDFQQQIRKRQVWARACYVLMVDIPGAFDKHVRILVADFLKEIPMPLFHPMKYDINIVSLKEIHMSMAVYVRLRTGRS